MLKTVSIGLMGMMILVGCGSSHSETINNNLVEKNNFSKKDRDLIYKSMKNFPSKVELSIAKIKNGDVFYYGAKKSSAIETIENQKKSFMIGSISKVLTSTLLAQMVIDEKIALDDNIEEKLPYKLNNNIAITYKQLANHTSGLASDATHVFADKERYHKFTYKNIENYLEHNLSLETEQDSFEYSNFGVATLGYMLTSIENKSYETLLQERIFDKFNMKQSTSLRENSKNLVPALMANDDPIPFGFKSAGGVISTVEDLYAFSLASFSDLPEVLLTQKETFKVDDEISMGLGWHIFTDAETESKFYFHGGTTEGYRSVLILGRENQNGIIILSNLPIDVEGSPIFDLGRELMTEMVLQGML